MATISGMESVDGARRELAAQLLPLSRSLAAAENSLLAKRGIGMWEYIILTVLAAGDSPTQLELARATGRDKTRLIGNLDALESAHLVARRPDPADRRARIIEITPAGRQRFADCEADIRHMEDALLVGIPAADRRTFLGVLEILGQRAIEVGTLDPGGLAPGTHGGHDDSDSSAHHPGGTR